MINFFISDLHLEASRPDITSLFFKFLEDQTKPNQTLYILGDFFEAWVGDDDLTPFNLSIIEALKKATSQGLPIYIMHGNRDFLLGKKFLRASGCKLLPDEFVVNLNGIPTLLMHGDTLCTDDKKYLEFRKKTRSWLGKKIILLHSLKKRQAMAAHYREQSKKYTSTAPQNIMDVTQHEVARLMQKHNVQHLIHGHTHREAVHSFELNGMPATRTVLGPWHTEGRALRCDEDGKQTLIKF